MFPSRRDLAITIFLVVGVVAVIIIVSIFYARIGN